MRRLLFAAAVAVVMSATNVMAAAMDVSKIWNTSDQASMVIDEYNDVWSPAHAELVATAVFDDSNRYQGTDITITRMAWSAYNPDGSYVFFYRTMTCRILDRVLRVSQGGAALVATTLDPASPDCSNYGYRVDCDQEGNCAFNDNYGFSGPRIVQGSWGPPAKSSFATSNVHSESTTALNLPRMNQVCKTFEGKGMSGSFSIGSLLWYSVGSALQTQCQTTLHSTDPW